MSATVTGIAKSPGVILAEITMTRTNYRGAFVLVEGDDDSRFWRARLPAPRARVVICMGRTNLLDVAGRTLVMRDIVGIYDKDLDALFGLRHHPTKLAATDENDLELTLLQSPALGRVLDELADGARLASFELQAGASVIEHLQATSYEFGCLRYLNRLRSWGVCFDELSPYRFVSRQTWQLDRTGLQAAFCALAGITAGTLQGELVNCPQRQVWNLSQGHDTLRILAQGLKCVIGVRGNCDEQDVLRALRLTHRPEELAITQLWSDLRQMEANLGLQITS